MTSRFPNGERDRSRQDETVGYRSPQKHSRFKPGQSGNVRGRPRRKLALNNIVEEVATMPVQVTVDGRVLKMSALKAILMLEVRKALQGDGKASRFVLETFEARGLGGAINGSEEDFVARAAGARERLLRAVEVALENGAQLMPDASTMPGETGQSASAADCTDNNAVLKPSGDAGEAAHGTSVGSSMK